MILIRTEEPKDWAQVETLTRKAFYNQYMPGCMEHYLVHIMRGHPDFIPQLDLVAEIDGQIVGNIMYTKAKLVAEDGQEKEILTFGPLCVDPDHQRQGIGKALMEKSFTCAKEMGYDVIVIFGSPANYVTSGFVSCKKHNICLENGKFPATMSSDELKKSVAKRLLVLQRSINLIQFIRLQIQHFISAFCFFMGNLL